MGVNIEKRFRLALSRVAKANNSTLKKSINFSLPF